MGREIDVPRGSQASRRLATTLPLLVARHDLGSRELERRPISSSSIARRTASVRFVDAIRRWHSGSRLRSPLTQRCSPSEGAGRHRPGAFHDRGHNGVSRRRSVTLDSIGRAVTTFEAAACRCDATGITDEGVVMRRSRRTMVVLGVAFLTVSVALGVGAALAADSENEAIDRGPFIDYCPTLEQTEAHFSEYGFDYKPTVPCGENGEELSVVAEPSETPSEEEIFASEKQMIATAKRAPDRDGDPLSFELILADGRETTIEIDGNPDFFEGMTPRELAEVLYP
jgi:hypothetical protein